MNKQEFISIVAAELVTIKTNATPAEINNLHKELFDAAQRSLCIYGLMTGDCMSERAQKINPKVYINATSDKKSFFGNTYVRFEDHSFEKVGEDQAPYLIMFTALEKYLFMSNKDMHHEIIAYLRDEIPSIVLT